MNTIERLREISKPLIGRTQFSFSVQNDLAGFLSALNSKENHASIDLDGIVLNGKPCTGKTEILEKVLVDRTKIIYPETDEVDDSLIENSNVFIALDEGNKFEEKKLVTYLDKIKKSGKKFILSVQHFDSLSDSVKKKITTGFKNVEIINL
ncbi:TPA: hypothetical protein ACGIK9_002847 [Acinetobacter baumannii]|uniref:hypothetical protein n=1 Tax=Acinetobacter baumannii TaxID=470 RepID=UPI00339073E1